jgi:SAM-dependent methyltransferase
MPAFATDKATAAYYDQRAAEYDEWYTGAGQFAARDRPGWHDELQRVIELIRHLPEGRTLDIACGTGFLTRHLPDFVLGLDQSPSMVAICQSRLPRGFAIVADALRLPLADASFDRVFTGHFYGHLSETERSVFFEEVRRVARQLIVVDSALRPGVAPEESQTRILNDGSSHRVYKRYLTGAGLAEEIDGEILLEGTWFVAAQARW